MIPIAKPFLTEDEEREVLEVMRSGMLSMGDMVRKLEQSFAEKYGYAHVIATSSGTTALQTALYVHGIGAGDEVITTPFTFIATANTILSVGAKPVFVDIQDETCNLNPQLIREKITQKTRAIMPVHLYGCPCDMDEISAVARENNLIIIEDACQAHGARYRNRFVGSWGSAAFSLYSTKNMVAGEGGLLCVHQDDLAEKARLYINHGQEKRYQHISFGLNYRLTNIQAAIAVVQLRKLSEFNKKRQENARYLMDHLQGVGVPLLREDSEHVFHQFTIRLSENRDLIAKKLEEAGIGTGIHYPLPIHKQPYYQQLGYGSWYLPVAEKVAREILSLPVHPLVSKEDLKRIVETVNELVGKYSCIN